MSKEPNSLNNNKASNEHNPWDELALMGDQTRKKEYEESAAGQKELNMEDEFDKRMAQIDQMLAEGKITQEQAIELQEKMLDKAIEKTDEYRKEYGESMQSANTQGGTDLAIVNDDVERVVPDAVVDKDGNVTPIDGSSSEEDRARHEDEKRKQHEEDMRQLDENEKRKQKANEKDQEVLDKMQQLKDHEELDENEKKKQKAEEKKRKIEEKLRALRNSPLAGINADFTFDKTDLARHYAKETLNKELSDAHGVSGIIKKIFKGNLLNKAYQRRYEKELMTGQRTVTEGDKEMTIDDIIEGRSEVNLDRLLEAATNEYKEEFLHDKAGETLTEADAETTNRIRSAITDYVNAINAGGQNIDELKTEFNNRVKEIQAEARDDGKNINNNFHNNYLKVAENVIELTRHGEAIDKVMEGFKVYNADVRSDIRTAEHRDTIDKLVDKVVEGRLGRYIPAEVIATAAGAAVTMGKSGARVAGPIGAILVSAISGGAREAKRFTEDRTQMIRNMAQGKDYDGPANRNTGDRKREKYETELYGTVYELTNATDLTADIKKALESNDREKVLESLTQAVFRRDYTDQTKKDLIAYSSPDKIGDERFALDKAIAEARASLSKVDKEVFAEMQKIIRASVENDDSTFSNEFNEFKDIKESVLDKDSTAKRIRLSRAMKQAGKTAAIGAIVGAAISFGGQEISALLDPKKLSVIEKIRGVNKDATQETFLAGHWGGPGVKTSTVKGIDGDNWAMRNKLKNQGYTEKMVSPAHTQPNGQKIVGIDPGKSPNRLKMTIDQFADNGTKAADGNEVRILTGKGELTCALHGNSTLPDGGVINYENAVKAGKIRGVINIKGTNFEVVADRVNKAGQPVFGHNGVFTTTTGETIKGFGKNNEEVFKNFRIIYDNGTDAKGKLHAISLATEVGKNNFKGKIQSTIDTFIDVPAKYDYIKEVVNRVLPVRFIPLPFVTRQNIGAAQPNPTPEPTPPEPTPPEPTPPEPEPNPFQPPAVVDNPFQPPATRDNDFRPPATRDNDFRPPATRDNDFRPPATTNNPNTNRDNVIRLGNNDRFQPPATIGTDVGPANRDRSQGNEGDVYVSDEVETIRPEDVEVLDQNGNVLNDFRPPATANNSNPGTDNVIRLGDNDRFQPPAVAQEQAPDNNNAIDYNLYRDAIGDEGVRFFTSNEPLDPLFNDEFENWWNGLNEDQKRVAIDLAKDRPAATPGPDITVSQAIGDWIKGQPEYYTL